MPPRASKQAKGPTPVLNLDSPLNRSPTAYQSEVQGMNLRRWDAVAATIKVIKTQAPLQTKPTRLADLRELPRKRLLQGSRRVGDNGEIFINVKNPKIAKDTRAFRIQDNELNGKFSEDVQKDIGRYIVALCERFPCCPLEIPESFAFIIIDAAVLLVVGSHAVGKIDMIQPRFSKTLREPKHHGCYMTSIQCFDDAGGAFDVKISVESTHMLTSKVVTVPSIYRWVPSRTVDAVEASIPGPAQHKSPAVKSMHQQALELCRWLAITYEGATGPADLIKTKIALAKTPFMGSKTSSSARGGIYNGGALWIVQPGDTTKADSSVVLPTRVLPSARVKQDVPKLPTIEVKSSLGIRMVSTLESILDAFMINETMKTAWKRGCVEADKENSRISADELPDVRIADCAMKPHDGRHVCQGCLRDHACDDFALVTDLSAQLCPSCQISRPSVADRDIAYRAKKRSEHGLNDEAIHDSDEEDDLKLEQAAEGKQVRKGKGAQKAIPPKAKQKQQEQQSLWTGPEPDYGFVDETASDEGTANLAKQRSRLKRKSTSTWRKNEQDPLIHDPQNYESDNESVYDPGKEKITKKGRGSKQKKARGQQPPCHVQDPQLPGYTKTRLWGRLLVFIKGDDVACGYESTKEKRWQRAHPIMEQLLQGQALPGNEGDIRKYRDAYVHQFVLDQDSSFTLTDGKKASPFIASIDGIYPLATYRLEDNTYAVGYHVLGNCCITTASLNMIKGLNGPISLRVIACFRNAQNQDDLENAMRGFAIMHINGLELAPNRAGNLTIGQSMQKSQIEELHHSQRRGELLPHRNAPRSKHFRVVGEKSSNVRRHGLKWRPSQHTWRWTQFMQIAEIYGFIDTNEDLAQWTTYDAQGRLVFFPFSSLSKPLVVWNHWINECWFSERLARMRRDCNRHFSTELNIDVLMFISLHCRLRALKADREELVKKGLYQVDGGRQLVARDISGLEACPFNRSPCTAALEKKVHGVEMSHGFTSLHPEDQKTDFDFEACNINLGTQCSNYGVWQYEPGVWHKIFEQFDHLRIEEDTYWPAGPITWSTDGMQLGAEQFIVQDTSNSEESEAEDEIQGSYDVLSQTPGLLRVQSNEFEDIETTNIELMKGLVAKMDENDMVSSLIHIQNALVQKRGMSAASYEPTQQSSGSGPVGGTSHEGLGQRLSSASRRRLSTTASMSPSDDALKIRERRRQGESEERRKNLEGKNE